jgi:acyl-CoA reductase-like NAD-dependent aldehyde dehydrogenase
MLPRSFRGLSHVLVGFDRASISWRSTNLLFLSQTKRMVQGVSIVDGKIVNINPANGQEISRVVCSTRDEIDQMMKKATQAQKTKWGTMPVKERVHYLREGLQEIAKQSEKFVSLIVQEMGKPSAEARIEMDGACHKEAHLGIMEEMSKPVHNGTHSVVVRQPLGVVAILSPWNYPCDEILLLALPALVAGNTVIVKPSEVAPETGALTVQTLAARLPEHVLQLAQGNGSVGALLVSHPTTAMIAMTGSSATGKAILASAAPELKRVVLELGGKDPMLVFADCKDVVKAADDAVRYSLSNAGQVCCSLERIYVADAIYEDFVAATALAASTYKVGNGQDPTVSVGPLVSTLQRDKVQEHVNDAVKKGARLVYQSQAPEEGSFCPVTVLADVSDGMKVYREETFGPVVCLSKFDGTEEEAVRLANDTEYGLASSIYTSDIAKASRVAGQIDAGQVGINCYAIENMHEACPWVGHKDSGLGFHSGREGFLNFSIPKTIVYDGVAPDSDAQK